MKPIQFLFFKIPGGEAEALGAGRIFNSQNFGAVFSMFEHMRTFARRTYPTRIEIDASFSEQDQKEEKRTNTPMPKPDGPLPISHLI